MSCILITGTSHGLGNDLTKYYLDKGHIVYGCSRSVPTLSHSNYKHFILDIRNPLDVSAMFSDIRKMGNPIEILINNAGISQTSLTIATPDEVATNIIQTNLLGTYFVTRAALKDMLRSNYGRIVNFSSINLPQGSIGSAVYNASKAGIEGLTVALSREFGRANITINTIGLSLVSNSGMLKELSERASLTKREQLIKGEILNIEEIIHAIDFITSPISKNITCQKIYFGGA
ncbi:SDR family NAD(P)-dependent oxidoreductase [Polynucleobacter hallstattensis]|uniref:SDR family NAD(P)-dependent oxidoreductase n=1 Tax=Polynucleobacter hallstattensis TaxID=1855586 RepID=UPI001C0AF100|nr:SDR family oxidoreductase [Polynucleobacter hallstattensis]MBU3560597.1 SDR family oxidoreductase [Polynucleobacter hallstattensis]